MATDGPIHRHAAGEEWPGYSPTKHLTWQLAGSVPLRVLFEFNPSSSLLMFCV